MASSSELIGQLGGSGGLTDEERKYFFGSVNYSSAPVASMVWTGPEWSPPPNTYQRLMVNSQGRLTAGIDTHNCVTINSRLNEAYLTTPVNGFYQLSVIQTFAESTTFHRGAGLSASPSSDSPRFVWGDTNIGRFAQATSEVYLTAGTRLYPWVWIGGNRSRMCSEDSGLVSSYSFRFLRSN